MEMNAAYGFSQQNQQCSSKSDYDNDSVYEELQPVNENIYDVDNTYAYELQTAKAIAMSEKKQDLVSIPQVQQEQVNRKKRGTRIVFAIAVAAVLALAVTAIILSILLTNKSDQEINSLQQEIANLRVKLNQTGDNSNQEINSLQQELANLRAKLNLTGDNSNQEINSLQQELANLRAKLNLTGDNSNQEINSLQLELANLRETLEMDNQAQDSELYKRSSECFVSLTIVLLTKLIIINIYACMLQNE